MSVHELLVAACRGLNICLYPQRNERMKMIDRGKMLE